jgi:hypothetical protein
MKTHDRRSLDDRTIENGKQSAKMPKPRPANVEQSIRDLQATVGNRAVGDLMAGSGPVLQGSFFGSAFGGLEDWLGEESSGGRPGLDPGSKAEAADASMKETLSDNSMKGADASEKWDPSQKFDASDKWDASQKLDASDKWDASQKLDASYKWDASQKLDASDKWDASQKLDASDKWDASQKLDASDKWDASQKLDASDKWDASEKSELGLASKDDELGSELEFKEF